MTRRYSILVLVLFLMFVTFTPAFASPYAFSAGATARSLDVGLNLTAADVSLEVGTLDAVQGFDEVNPPATAGTGEGINLVVHVGDPGLGVDVVNVASLHTLGDGPDAHTDSDSVVNIDSDLVDVGVLSMNTRSLTTNTGANTTMDWSLAGLTVHGNIPGTVNLLTTDAITGTAETNTDGDGMMVSVGHTEIEGLVLEVPLGLLTLELVSADVISTTARAAGDGTAGGADAHANTEFVNLRIQGELIETPAPGTVIDLEALGVTIGTVTIRPIEQTSVTATMSSAQAVALQVRVLEVLGLVGIEMDVGTTTAHASVEPGVPTAVTVTGMHLTPGDNLPYAFLALGVLGGLFGLAVVSRRTR